MAGRDAPVRDYAAADVPRALVEQRALPRERDRGAGEARDLAGDAQPVVRAVGVHRLEPPGGAGRKRPTVRGMGDVRNATGWVKVASLQSMTATQAVESAVEWVLW